MRKAAASGLVCFLAMLFACEHARPPVPEDDAFPENYTTAEQAAMHARDQAGNVVIAVTDARTRAPIAECDYGEARFSLQKEQLDRRLPIEISTTAPSEAADGVHRFSLTQGWWRLRLSAPGYRETWTPPFRVESGKDTAIRTGLERANEVRVRVLDTDGRPLREGTLLLTAPGLKSTLVIRDGIGQKLVDVDELTIQVSPIFMPDYRSQSVKAALAYGETTEVVIRLGS